MITAMAVPVVAVPLTSLVTFLCQAEPARYFDFTATTG